MDFKYEIEKVKLIKISDEEFNMNGIPSNVRKSIALYNKAIVDLQINRVDLSIDDLKKSVSLNPGFCEAIKLLGLSYVLEKDFNKAEKTFKRLYEYDGYSTMAKNYIKELSIERTTAKTVDLIRNVSSNSDINGNKLKNNNRAANNNGFSKKLVVVSLVSTIIIVSLGVTYWYWTRLNTQAVANKPADAATVTSKPQKDTAADQVKIKNDNIAVKKPEKSLDTAKLEEDNYKNNVILKLDAAEKLYQNGEYEKAAGSLITLKTLKLKDEEKSRFDEMWNYIKTKEVWNIYNQANKLYKGKNYQEALPKLIIVEELAPELNIAPWVLYQTGMCYKENNDSKNALILFQKVKSSYPNSEYARYSENMINELGAR